MYSMQHGTKKYGLRAHLDPTARKWGVRTPGPPLHRIAATGSWGCRAHGAGGVRPGCESNVKATFNTPVGYLGRGYQEKKPGGVVLQTPEEDVENFLPVPGKNLLGKYILGASCILVFSLQNECSSNHQTAALIKRFNACVLCQRCYAGCCCCELVILRCASDLKGDQMDAPFISKLNAHNES